MLVVMGERGMFPPALATAPADVMTAVFDAADLPHAMRLAARSAAKGCACWSIRTRQDGPADQVR
jgi:hypothetical protein